MFRNVLQLYVLITDLEGEEPVSRRTGMANVAKISQGGAVQESVQWGLHLDQICNIHISVAWQLLSRSGECVFCKDTTKLWRLLSPTDGSGLSWNSGQALSQFTFICKCFLLGENWNFTFPALTARDCQVNAHQQMSYTWAWLCQDLETNQGLSLTSQFAVFHSFLKVYLSKWFYKHYLSPVAFVSHVTSQILNASSRDSHSFRLPVYWQLFSSDLLLFKKKLKT